MDTRHGSIRFFAVMAAGAALGLTGCGGSGPGKLLKGWTEAPELKAGSVAVIGSGLGTGFFVEHEETRYVITAGHVVSEVPRAQLMLERQNEDGEPYTIFLPAEVLVVEHDTDVAVLGVDADLPAEATPIRELVQAGAPGACPERLEVIGLRMDEITRAPTALMTQNVDVQTCDAQVPLPDVVPGQVTGTVRGITASGLIRQGTSGGPALDPDTGKVRGVAIMASPSAVGIAGHGAIRAALQRAARGRPDTGLLDLARSSRERLLTAVRQADGAGQHRLADKHVAPSDRVRIAAAVAAAGVDPSSGEGVRLRRQQAHALARRMLDINIFRPGSGDATYRSMAQALHPDEYRVEFEQAGRTRSVCLRWEHGQLHHSLFPCSGDGDEYPWTVAARQQPDPGALEARRRLHELFSHFDRHSQR